MQQIISAVSIAAVLAGCAIQPELLTSELIQSEASDRLERVSSLQEPVNRPIDLYEAMARAIKYNLDYRVEIMEKAVRSKRLDLARYEMLPSLVANSDYSGRSNYSGGQSRLILGERRLGAQSLNSSTSQELDVFRQDLTFSWNVLDFGLSYIRAKQSADEVLIAEENKRRVVNRLIEDVRTAYWRAVSSERLIARLRKLERRVRQAITDSRTLAENQQGPLVTALTFERELIEIKREIQILESELNVSRSQLAALMNIKPGSSFRLAGGRHRHATPRLRKPYRELVVVAMNNRPEFREVLYRMRINQKEADAALLELLPGLQLYAGGNFDSNEFLFSQNWLSWSAKASWNLIKVFQYPKRRAVIDGQDSLLDQRSLALTMAIMTQVHVSRVRFLHARKLSATASEYRQVQNRLIKQLRIEADANRVSEQTLIREEMNTLVAEVRYDIAFANLQNAYANIFASIGLDPYQADVSDDMPVKELAHALRHVWIERGDPGAFHKTASLGEQAAK